MPGNHEMKLQAKLPGIKHFRRMKIFWDEARCARSLFDTAWYSKQSSSRWGRRRFAVYHYLLHGALAGRDPHPLFSTSWYLNTNSDVSAEGYNPLLHFLRYGWREGRNPHPYFGTKWYLDTYPDVREAGFNPILHYLDHGADEGRQPNNFFDGGWYLARYPDVRQAGANPLIHYRLHGRDEGRSQNEMEEELRLPVAPAYNLDGFSSHLEKADFMPGQAVDGQSALLELAPDPSVKLVTVDVWDTLLRRDCHPAEIKLQSARFLYLTCYRLLKPAFRNVNDLYMARLDSENRAAPGGDFEFRFEEAIPLWQTTVFQNGCSIETLADIKRTLLEHEYEAELRSTRPDEPARNFVSRFPAPTVTFLSDFYMPADFLKKLLDAKGFGQTISRGTASSDHMKTKRSGELFQVVAEDFSVDMADILHIGDNKEADDTVPGKLGLRTIHYTVSEETARTVWFGLAFHRLVAGDRASHHTRIMALIEDRVRAAKRAKDWDDQDWALYQIGMRLSPVAVGLLLFIIEESLCSEAESIYFFTREGIFLKEVFDNIAGQNPYNVSYPKSELLEVSRQSTFMASLAEFSPRELMRLWSLYSKQSPKSFCTSLNIERDDAEPIFKRYHLEYEEVLRHPWKSRLFRKVIDSPEFVALARNKQKSEADLLRRYLEQVSFGRNGKKVLTVDLGWRGTIQDNLCRMTDAHLHGIYLGLFKFLNAQPTNGSKSGWLFDHQTNEHAWRGQEVAPIEMIFNSAGGSVLGYRREQDSVVAEKLTVPGEESIITGKIRKLQLGVLDTIEPLIEYVRLHGLTSHDLRALAQGLSRALLERPPSAIADAFFAMEHNETFGTGEVDELGLTDKFLDTLESKAGPELHDSATRLLSHVRWPEGFTRQSAILRAVGQTDAGKRNALPSSFHKELTFSGIKKSGRPPRVGVFIPALIEGSGGHRTIFNSVRKLSANGIEVLCLLEGVGAGEEALKNFLGDSKAFVSIGWENRFDLDLAIATIAHSAKHVATLPNAELKAYLVQDFEASFNPVGDAYLAAETSYSLGLNHFTIGNWLSHLLKVRYGQSACPAGLGVDTSIYYPRADTVRERAVCFLYQPDKPRRASALGIRALEIVKSRRPDIDICVYGSDLPINLPFDAENLGLIRDLAGINDLYNTCSVGLCISASNPSRIPFEMMAAGVVPVDIYRYNNLLDYRDGTIVLAYQTSESIAEAIFRLFDDEKALMDRSAACIEFAKPRTLDWETEAICNGVMSLLESGELPRIDLPPVFGDLPVFAEEDLANHAHAFCEWQKTMARCRGETDGRSASGSMPDGLETRPGRGRSG